MPFHYIITFLGLLVKLKNSKPDATNIYKIYRSIISCHKNKEFHLTGNKEKELLLSPQLKRKNKTKQPSELRAQWQAVGKDGLPCRDANSSAAVVYGTLCQLQGGKLSLTWDL